MKLKKELLRTLSIVLCIGILLGCLPVYAADSGVKATFDEAYYATTDYYGNLTEGGVVKSYAMNGQTSLTDYGTYDEIINLTDSTEATAKNGKVEFSFADGEAPDHFYFEGKTASPYENLPWKLAVSYKLNGVPAEAEDLAGKTGEVEITIDITPNDNASEYAKNNYVLMAAAMFNQDNILSLDAPGAQVQLIGNLRTAIFMCMPGEEATDVIRVGSEDFSFGGLTFMMMPATLSQLDQIADLADDKEDLEENYDLLSDSLDSMLDAVDGMSGSLNQTANGLDQLNSARGTVSANKGGIYADVDKVSGDLTSLTDVLTPIADRTQTLSQLVTDVTAVLNSMSDAALKMKNNLVTIENTLSDLDDEETLSKLTDDMSDLSTRLSSLRSALEKEGKSASSSSASSSDSSYSDQIDQVVQMHNIYASPDFGTFLAQMLVLSGKVSADNASAAAANLEPLVGMTQEQAEAAGQLENWNTVQQLHSLYTGIQGGMSFQQFCATVLQNFKGMSKETAASTAETMDQIWTLYEDGGADTDSKETILMLLDSLDIASEEISETTSALLTPTANVLAAAEDLCDDMADMLQILDDNDINAAGVEASQQAEKVLTDADKLRQILNEYDPTLQEAIANMGTASTTMATTLTDLQRLIDDSEATLKAAGTQLDAGTAASLAGLSDTLRRAADSLDSSNSVRDAKDNISDIIEDTWDDYTGEENNMLNMDSTAEAESLTDSRNGAPQSIQVLIRTQEIKVPEEDTESEEATAAETTTFWQRVGQMFIDLWDTITGIFR